jgi:hypothetical protein
MSKRAWKFDCLLALPFVAMGGGCWEESDAGTVRIFNDTGKSVLIWRCAKESCGGTSITDPYPDKSVWRPWEKGGDTNVSKHGVPNVFLVLEPGTERRLGCLPVVMPKERKGVVVRVFEMVPCRSSYDERVPWPPLRPGEPS